MSEEELESDENEKSFSRPSTSYNMDNNEDDNSPEDMGSNTGAEPKVSFSEPESKENSLQTVQNLSDSLTKMLEKSLTANSFPLDQTLSKDSAARDTINQSSLSSTNKSSVRMSDTNKSKSISSNLRNISRSIKSSMVISSKKGNTQSNMSENMRNSNVPNSRSMANQITEQDILESSQKRISGSRTKSIKLSKGSNTETILTPSNLNNASTDDTQQVLLEDIEEMIINSIQYANKQNEEEKAKSISSTENERQKSINRILTKISRMKTEDNFSNEQRKSIASSSRDVNVDDNLFDISSGTFSSDVKEDIYIPTRKGASHESNLIGSRSIEEEACEEIDENNLNVVAGQTENACRQRATLARNPCRQQTGLTIHRRNIPINDRWQNNTTFRVIIIFLLLILWIYFYIYLFFMAIVIYQYLFGY